jgi:hypothetical protein
MNNDRLLGLPIEGRSIGGLGPKRPTRSSVIRIDSRRSPEPQLYPDAR